MPGYLYQDQFTPIPVYQSPLDLYGQALQVKDARFAQGLANIRSRYDSVLNADLTNPENEMKVRAGIQGAMNKLSRVSTMDLSIPENQGQVNSLFDNILDDNDIMYDMGWTRSLKSELTKAEQLQRTKPELVPDQNLEPLYRAQEEYKNSPKTSRPGVPHFTPYYDFNTKYNADLDKIKSDVDVAFAQSGDTVIQMPDGTSVNLGSIQDQHLVESIKASKVNEMLWQKISSDPQAMHQMGLDYAYNKNHGMFTGEGASQGIDQDVATYKSIASGISSTMAGATPEQKQQYQKQLDYYNQEVSRLTSLKSRIQAGSADPGEYYTFGKVIKDYVESKSSQYSHTKEGLWSAMPGYDIYLKGRFDMLQEAMKAKAKIGDQIPVETPVADIYNNLIEHPGGIKISDKDLAAIGEITDKNGDYNIADGKYNLSFSNKNPENTVIIVPATGAFQPEQITDMNNAGTLSRFKGELEGLGITQKVIQTDHNHLAVYGANGSPIDQNVSVSADDIIRNYSSNKNAYPEYADKIKAVYDKYTPMFAKAGADMSPDSLNKIDQKIQDPKLKTAIEFGQSLVNQAFKGKFNFRPDEDSNLALGDNQIPYLKGRLAIPADELNHVIDKHTKQALLDAGILTKEEIAPGLEYEGNKRPPQQVYGLSVYLPSNGGAVDVNDRLLQQRKLYYGSSKEDYMMRAQSKANAIGFGNDLQAARGYGFKTPLDESGRPVYKPTTSTGFGGLPTEHGPQDVEQFKQLASDIAASTGADSGDILNSIYSIIQSSTNKETGVRNPVKIYEGIGHLNQGLGAAAFGNVAQFMKGIAGPESAGYDVGNAQTSAYGKYQITQATYEKIRELPTFPSTYKLDSFSDYKSNPQLQEIAMATYSDYLLKKFQNPLAAAVAFYTGEGSPETQAFAKDPQAAMKEYGDKKPSSGGSNTNMTIGAYLSAFLKNAR